jgi:hypothetical protein
MLEKLEGPAEIGSWTVAGSALSLILPPSKEGYWPLGRSK